MSEHLTASPQAPSLDLSYAVRRKSAREYVAFLKAVDSCGGNLYSGAALQRAIWRYETMWLPLLCAVSLEYEHSTGESTDCLDYADIHSCPLVRKVHDIVPQRKRTEPFEIVPPLDVAWVWYLHRLAGDVYLEDVRQCVGMSIAPDHTAAFKYGLSNRAKGAFLWNKVYRTQQASNECRSYFPKYLGAIFDTAKGTLRKRTGLGTIPLATYISRLEYDVACAAESHRGVLTACLYNRTADVNYVDSAFERYQRYLQVLPDHGNRQLLPPADIDLAWRIHAGSLADYLDDQLVKHMLSSCDMSHRGQKAHPQAFSIIRGMCCQGVVADEKDLKEKSTAWAEQFETRLGPYILPNTVAAIKPAGTRDGYVQIIVQKYVAQQGNDDNDSANSYSSACNLLTDSENSDYSSRLSSVSESDSDILDRGEPVNLSPNQNAGDGSRGHASMASHSTYQSVHSENVMSTSFSGPSSSLVAPEGGYNGLESIKNSPKNPGIRHMSSTSSGSKRAASFLREDAAGCSELSISDDLRNALLQNRNRDECCVVVKCQALDISSHDSADPVHVSPRKRGKQLNIDKESSKLHRKEMRKRVREQKEFQKDALRHAQHAHGLSGNKAEKFSRVQIARGFILCLFAFVLAITGVVCMAGLDSAGRTGDFLFLAGMVSFLLGSCALTRQDANVRAEKREQARQRREQRKANASDVKAQKESKESFTAGIRIFTFSSTEAVIQVGGHDDGLASCSASFDWVESSSPDK